MTLLLEKAFGKASELEATDQDDLAQWLLEEIQHEERWKHSFRKSQDLLGQLADEALQEFRSGKTKELEPEKPNRL